MESLSGENELPKTEAFTLPTCEIDEDVYKTVVLQLSPTVTEDAEEEELRKQLEGLGLGAPPSPQLQLQPQRQPAQPPRSSSSPQTPVDSLASSLSTKTFASGSTVRAAPSRLSSPSNGLSGTALTESRSITQPTTHPAPSLQRSQSTFVHSSQGDKGRNSGFRLGFFKMASFKKRKSMPPWSPTLTSLTSDGNQTQDSDETSQQSGGKSLGSLESSKSSWSNAASAPKSSYEQPVFSDADALQRGLECQAMLELRRSQLAERDRFLDFQQALLDRLGEYREEAKAARGRLHQRAVEEYQRKMDKAVDDLETRQLEEEMKLQREHELEKQRAMVRLRHMEAYCRSQMLPAATAGPATDGGRPERRVTQKNYHNLAQQYRERDSMDNLHASKVNVLRGKQNKTVENLIRRGRQEIDKIKKGHDRELEAIDKAYVSQKDRLDLILAAKRARLETRWRMKALIIRTQADQRTGLKHSALPDVTTSQESVDRVISA
ncbi:hypothetical protein DV735_g274, partial [Chaetothyriales sp. CBS 134920]